MWTTIAPVTWKMSHPHVGNTLYSCPALISTGQDLSRTKLCGPCPFKASRSSKSGTSANVYSESESLLLSVSCAVSPSSLFIN